VSRSRPPLILIAALLVFACGCGYERTKPPDLAAPAPPTGFQKRSFKKEGLALSAPVNWRPTAGKAPLVQAARGRDRSLRLDKPRIVTIDGAPGAVLTGVETILGKRRRVRSVHVYTPRAEVVIDAFAPPAVFARVDRQVFRAVVASLRVRGRGSS
jgi:hypothetical protein